MSVKATNEGKCFVCDQNIIRSSAEQHITKCIKPEGTEGHIIEITTNSTFWMYAFVHAKTTFRDLDEFMRKKWVECCNHRSFFHIGDSILASDIKENFEESMDQPLLNLISNHPNIRYTYDEGEPTEITITNRSSVNGCAEPSIALLARNYMPHYPCKNCSETAEAICKECEQCVCEECADIHECGQENLLSTSNSPRMGVCEYEGLYDDNYELEDIGY